MDVKRAKRESVNKNIESLCANPNSKSLYKFLKGSKNQVSNNSNTKWSSENDMNFLKHLKNQVTDLSTIPIPPIPSPPESIFSLNEFLNVLETKKKPSAAGIDKITYEMLNNLSFHSKSILLQALNEAWYNCRIEENWRMIKVVPIPKRNKDLSIYTNFRPIALLSVFIKVINLMVKSRLETFLNENNTLPTRSYAYRKGRSASTCINDILHTITLAKERNEKVILLSLDVSQAYDCVDINRLYHVLLSSKTPQPLIYWIINFLKKRFLVLGNHKVEISNGLPQGSCLSPTLFNIYTKDLHNIVNQNTHLYQFADDFIIISHDKDFKSACMNLQHKSNQFSSMLKILNLTFNPAKTAVMYVAKGARLEPKITLSNTQIKCVKSLKFLGRHIKNSLSLKEHYDEVLSSCKPAINAIKMVSSAKSSMKPQVSIKLSKSLVFSKSQYAISSMAHAPKYINAKLTSFQNQLLRSNLGLTKSTPIQVIHALSATMPPKQRAQYLAAKELLRLKLLNRAVYNQITSNPSSKSSLGFVFKKFKSTFNNLAPITSNPSSSKIEINMNICQWNKSNTPKEVLKALYSETINQLRGEGFCIWATDASVGNNSTGCAACNISCQQFFLFTIKQKTSSLTGELHAIDKTIDLIIEDGMEKAVIITDSKNACLLLINNTSLNALVDNIKQKIYHSLIQKIVLIWAPSHVGIKPNETADYFAKAATSAGMEIPLIMSLKDASRAIYNELWNEWVEDYKNMSFKNGHHFASIFPTPPRRLWFQNLHLPAYQIKLINRLMAGHTKSKVFLKLMALTPSDKCDSCGTTENADHLIFVCPKFNDSRNKFNFFNKYNNTSQILKNFKINEITELLNFIELNNILL